MKFFYGCTTLVFFFATCQGRSALDLWYLHDTIDSIVDSSKIITDGLAGEILDVAADLEEIGKKMNIINAKVIVNSLTDSLANLVDNIFKIFEFPNEGISAVEDSLRIDKRSKKQQFQNILHDLAVEALKTIEETTGKGVDKKVDFIEELQDGVSKIVDDFLQNYDIAVKGVQVMKDMFLEPKDEISAELRKRILGLDLNLLGEKTELGSMKENPLETLLIGIGKLVSGVGNKLVYVLQETRTIKTNFGYEVLDRTRTFLENTNNFIYNLAEKYTKDKEKTEDVKAAMKIILKNKISEDAEIVITSYTNTVNGLDLAQKLIHSTAEEILELVTSADKAITDLAVGSLKGIYGGLTNILNLKMVIANKAQEILHRLSPKLISRATDLVNDVDLVGENTASGKNNEIMKTADDASSLMIDTIERVKLISEGTHEISENIEISRIRINSVILEFVRLLFGDISENDMKGFEAIKDVIQRYNSMAIDNLSKDAAVPAQ